MIEGTWEIVDQTNVGIHAIQWEGGDLAIHGPWKRKIAFFSFEGGRVSGDEHGLRVTIAADRFVRTTFLPIAISE